MTGRRSRGLRRPTAPVGSAAPDLGLGGGLDRRADPDLAGAALDLLADGPAPALGLRRGPGLGGRRDPPDGRLTAHRRGGRGPRRGGAPWLIAAAVGRRLRLPAALAGHDLAVGP